MSSEVAEQAPAPTEVPSISAHELADRLAAGETITVLDVRTDADWGVRALAAIVKHVPAAEVLADVPGAARELRDPVAVVCARGLTAQPVVQALRDAGVQVVGLENGLRGWIGVLQPRELDLGVDGLAAWQIQRPGRGCLSYLLAGDGSALVVDPAPDAGAYVALAERIGARITDVFDTHLHADHLSGARELARRTGAALRLPAAALERGVAYAGAVQPLHDGQELALGSLTLRAVALPGHTTDMTGLLLAGRVLVGGDSLFADGIARPDLQKGDPAGAAKMARRLHRTIHERVLTLGGDVVLLPCHTHPVVLSEPVAPRLREVRAAVAELAIEDPDEFAHELLAGMPPRPENYEAIIAANAGEQAQDPELESGGNSCAAG